MMRVVEILSAAADGTRPRLLGHCAKLAWPLNAGTGTQGYGARIERPAGLDSVRKLFENLHVQS